jgi:Zn-dependent protease
MIGGFPQALVTFATGYAAIGVIIAIAFLVFGIERAHPAAHGAWAFRPLLIPGLALLWPYVAFRWLRGAPQDPAAEGRQRRQRALHARIWIAIAALGPAILIAGMALRPSDSLAPPIQIRAPRS